MKFVIVIVCLINLLYNMSSCYIWRIEKINSILLHFPCHFFYLLIIFFCISYYFLLFPFPHTSLLPPCAVVFKHMSFLIWVCKMYIILFYCESYFFCVFLTMQYFKDLFTAPKNETNVRYITFLKFLRSFYYKFLSPLPMLHATVLI